MRKRTLLLDADIVAYKCAANAEDIFRFNPDEPHAVAVHVGDPDEACRNVDAYIAELADELGASRVVICLTDEVNFRKQLDPTYKSNRAGTRKPEHLLLMKQYMAAEYPSYVRARLEADDVMGILATTERFIEGEKIIVSEDKDMRTVPALLFNPRKEGKDRKVVHVSELEAARFHMEQTITGDPTDGYPGCYGIGAKSPWVAAVRECNEIKDLWPIVVQAYASKGKTEEDALLQARLAFILRDGWFNYKSKKIKLFQPPAN